MAGKRWYTPSPEQEAMATELYELREARGMSQAQAAKSCGLPPPKLSEIETGTRPIAEDELLKLVGFLDVEPATTRRLNRLRSTGIDGKAEWFADYTWPSDDLRYVMRAEEYAEEIYASQEQYIPGLLQTKRYATALLTNLGNTGADLQEAVELRLERQGAFFRSKRHGVRFHAVIAEGLLHKGPREVLGEQLEHLLKAQRDGRLECRIVPEGVLMAVLGFVLMDFSFGRSIGYADGGLNEFDMCRMRDVEGLSDMRDRYSVYSGMALSPGESANLIEKYRKDL